MLNLLIDGNYLLHRMVFILQKNNELQFVPESILAYLNTWTKKFSFKNIYFVSDGTNHWRKRIYPEYKQTRQRDSTIDWKWVYQMYSTVKQNMPKKIQVIEEPSIEGDDWIVHLCNFNLKKGISNLILASDSDLKQILKINYSPLAYTLMLRDTSSTEKLYCPHNINYAMSRILEIANVNIFNSSDERDSLDFVKKLMSNYQIEYINHENSLFIKLITGDKSDNIPSIYNKLNKNGKPIGIGDTTANKIYSLFKEQYDQDIDFYRDEYKQYIINIILKLKKENTSLFNNIEKQLNINLNLIHLDERRLPVDIYTKIFQKIDPNPEW